MQRKQAAKVADLSFILSWPEPVEGRLQPSSFLLGIDLNEHIADVITAVRSVANKLGLAA